MFLEFQTKRDIFRKSNIRGQMDQKNEINRDATNAIN